jgi:hypothetical protein
MPNVDKLPYCVNNGYSHLGIEPRRRGFDDDREARKFGKLVYSRPLTSGIEGEWGCEGAPQDDQDEAQEVPEPGEDAAEVIADGGEDDVGRIAGTAFEVAAAEVTIDFQVSDDGFDGGAAAQLALDDTEDAALLARDEDATGILCVVAAVSLVDIGPLDRAAGECLGAVDDVPQGVTVVRVIG